MGKGSLVTSKARYTGWMIRRKTGFRRKKATMSGSRGKTRSGGVFRAKKGKLPSISRLIKQCDKLFSLKVRGIRPEHPNENGSCYTCDHITQKKKLQCSHYLSRYYKSARWDFDNCRPACFMCNIWKKGDLVNFRQRLIKEIGEKRVLAVEAKRNVSIKLTREYLNELIVSLREGSGSEVAP